MSKDKIWLSSPHMGTQEQEFVNTAFESNWVAPLGPNVNGFEKDLCEFTGASNAAALSSGTAALHLALIQLGVGLGDYVFCQSFTFSASANPIKYQGAHPVFIDSEPHTWNMSPIYLEEAIQDLINQGKKDKLKAIIPVHLYGMPAKMNEIIEISKKYGVSIIEDAAEALGSKFFLKNCGTLGDFGVLSFNGNKIITTSGGGALLANDKSEIDFTRFLATQARDNAPHYQHSHIGYNYRMSNIVAGIGRGQMIVLPERVEQRRANFARYFERYGNKPGIEFQPEIPGNYSNRWLTCILINPDITGFSREDLRLALEKENIESRPLWKPMHLQPVFEKELYYGESVSERLFDNGLCLPSGSNLRDEDFERIFEVMDGFFV